MIRTLFAVAVAGLIFAAASVTSQAAPIAPIGPAATAAQGNVTHVWYHHRHCWIGRYGHRHCGW
jgi:hypothetical protein